MEDLKKHVVIYANMNFQVVVQPLLWANIKHISKIKKYGVDIKKHNKFFDHFIVYDFETILSKTEI